MYITDKELFNHKNIKTMKAINVTTLLADEGHVLTQAADVEAEGRERFYTTEIILGCNDSVENYKEVSVSEVQTEEQKSKEEQKSDSSLTGEREEQETPVEVPLTGEQEAGDVE